MNDEALRKASLVAGLKLYGLGSQKSDVQKYAAKWRIKLPPLSEDSGLVWFYPTEIKQEPLSERIKELVENVGLEDFLTMVGWNRYVDDFEYGFDATGKGYDLAGTQSLMNPKLVQKGHIYTYLDTTISKLIYDLKTVVQVRQFAQQLTQNPEG